MYQPFVAVPSYESSEQREAPPWAHPAGDIARITPVPHLPEQQRTAPSARPPRHAHALVTGDSTPSGQASPETAGVAPAQAPETFSATLDVPPTNAAMSGHVPPAAAASPHVVALDVSALGPLSPFAAEPGVTDLFVNGAAGLWTDAGPGLLRRPEWTCTEPAIRELAVRLVALGGRHIDEASPCVDVRLADGIRVHAVLPPISSTGTLLSIRLPHADRFSLDSLAANGLCGAGDGYLERLRAAVASRQNILITGAAGSGKTTLLAALCGEAPPDERIVIIEDVAELRMLSHSSPGRPTSRAPAGSAWSRWCAKHCGCGRTGWCSGSAEEGRSVNCWQPSIRVTTEARARCTRILCGTSPLASKPLGRWPG
jgi:pilus assembly protein CpaF